MVVREKKEKRFFDPCAKICGVPCATVRRDTARNGRYQVTFQRCDAALEDIEGIDWAQPAVTEATDRYLSDPLPEGYGFTVEDITYYHGTETWTVHLRTARQFLGDVTGYQAQVEALENQVSEQKKTIQALESRPDGGAELEAALERAYEEGVESNG